jgi:hypothetical protein
MDIRQRQNLAMELFQMAKEDDPLRDPDQASKLSRNRFCLLYLRSMGLLFFGFLFMLLTYNTRDIVDILHSLILNNTDHLQ